MASKEELFVCAEKYLHIGWNIMPVGINKKPFEAWGRFQTNKISKEELKRQFELYPVTGIALITGSISGVVVVDVDDEKNGANQSDLLPTVTSKTGGGGWHYFYKYPGFIVKNRTGIKEKIDIRGDGGYAVLPPSKHNSGNNYEWLSSPFDHDLSELPLWVTSSTPQIQQFNNDIFFGVNEGQRNDSATKYIGKILSSLPPDLWEIAGWDALITWNTRNNPPLPNGELRNVFNSIQNRERLKRLTAVSSIDTKDRTKWNFFTTEQLFSKNLSSPDFLVEHLIVKNALNMISGDPGSMKSMIALHIATCVANEHLVFNQFATKKMSVLLIDDENGENELNKRFVKLNGISCAIHYLSNADPPVNFEIEDADFLIRKCKEENIRLVIFDSYVRFLGTLDENSSQDTAKVIKILKRFIKEEITVLIIHHHRKSGMIKNTKGQEARGSGDLLAGVNSHLTISKTNDILTIKQAKLREEKELEPFKIKIIDTDDDKITFDYLGSVKADKDKLEKAKACVLQVINVSKTILYTKEIVDEVNKQTGAGKGTTENAIAILIQEKQIELDPQSRKQNRKYYRMVTNETSEVQLSNVQP